MAKFVKGQSGNPNGRPSVVRQELIEKLNKAGLIDKSIAVLKEAINGKDRVEVAKYILDQRYGKAPQGVYITSDGKRLLVMDD